MTGSSPFSRILSSYSFRFFMTNVKYLQAASSYVAVFCPAPHQPLPIIDKSINKLWENTGGFGMVIYSLALLQEVSMVQNQKGFSTLPQARLLWPWSSPL
jgi:hypothetical protein